MAVTFSFKGIHFSVPAEELGEALRQLESLRDERPVAHKHYVVTKDLYRPDLSGSVNSIFKSYLQSAVKPVYGGGCIHAREGLERWEAAAQPERAESPKDSVDVLKALRFLKMVREFEGDGGATVELIMDALGAVHPKGVGSKMVKINEILQQAGFSDLSEVYVNPRDGSGVRSWRAGPKLSEAIAKLQKEVVPTQNHQ